MSFQRGQVVRYRGVTREKGIVLVATDRQVVVCTFPRRNKRKATIANYGPRELAVVGRTKKMPASCGEALVAMYEPKPKKKRSR